MSRRPPQPTPADLAAEVQRIREVIDQTRREVQAVSHELVWTNAPTGRADALRESSDSIDALAQALGMATSAAELTAQHLGELAQ